MEKIFEGYKVNGKKFVVFLVLGFVGLFAYTFFLWSYADLEGTRIPIGFYYMVFYTMLALIFVASVVLSLEKKVIRAHPVKETFLVSQRARKIQIIG